MKNLGVIIFLLAAFNFAHIMDFMIIMPLNPFLTEEAGLGISLDQFGLLVTAYTFAAGLSSLIVAPFIDRFDRKKALLFIFSGFTIATSGIAFSDSYTYLMFFRILSGMFGGITGTMVVSIVGDLIPFEKRGQAMSMIMMAFAVSSVIGMPVGIALASNFGWNAPFIFIALISVVIIAVASFVLPEMTGHIHKEESSKDILGVFKHAIFNQSQRNGLILMFLIILGQFTLIPNLSGYMVSNVGISKDELSWIYFAGGIATALSMIIVGKLSDKYDKANVFIISAGLSIIPMILITNLGESSILGVLMLTVPFFIFISGRMVPVQALVTSVVPSDERAGYMSLSTAVRDFTAGVAAMIGGYFIVETDGVISGYDIAGYIAGATSIVAMLFVKKVKPIKE